MMEGRLDRLLKNWPRVYHVTYTSNLPSIRSHGLFSASKLKEMAESNEGFRPDKLPLDCPRLGRVTLRDQAPMASHLLKVKKSLIGMSPEDWYRLIDDHIFFFFDCRNAETLFRKYKMRGERQTLLEIPTREILASASSAAHVTPINTGAVGPAYAQRGPKTFHKIDVWDRTGFIDKVRKQAKRPVELAVRQDNLQVRVRIVE